MTYTQQQTFDSLNHLVFTSWVMSLNPASDKVLDAIWTYPNVTIAVNLFYFFIWVLMSLPTHCIGRITMGSFIGRGNQYIQFVKSLFCKRPNNSKQLPAFPLEVRPGFEL